MSDIHVCGEPEGFCWDCVDTWTANQESKSKARPCCGGVTYHFDGCPEEK